jgi:hypothetical protein
MINEYNTVTLTWLFANKIQTRSCQAFGILNVQIFFSAQAHEAGNSGANNGQLFPLGRRAPGHTHQQE